MIQAIRATRYCSPLNNEQVWAAVLVSYFVSSIVKYSYRYVFRRSQSFIITYLIVTFVFTVAYDKSFPTDHALSLTRNLTIFVPGMVVAEIFRRRIKKQIREEREKANGSAIEVDKPHK